MPSAIADFASGHSASGDTRWSRALLHPAHRPVVPGLEPALEVEPGRVGARRRARSRRRRSPAARLPLLLLPQGFGLLSTRAPYTVAAVFVGISVLRQASAQLDERLRGRSRRPRQGFRRHARGRRRQPRRPDRHDLRHARPQRRRQDDDAAHAARHHRSVERARAACSATTARSRRRRRSAICPRSAASIRR